MDFVTSVVRIAFLPCNTRDTACSGAGIILSVHEWVTECQIGRVRDGGLVPARTRKPARPVLPGSVSATRQSLSDRFMIRRGIPGSSLRHPEKAQFDRAARCFRAGFCGVGIDL